jgi:dihydroorotate dehydrogenase (NAD+) catalytic subunit
MVRAGLSVKIGRIKMKNPVTVASGTFGCGKELEDVADAKKLGAIVAKTVTLYPRDGNPSPRIAEAPSGMLNAIGIENDGVDAFIRDKMPYLRSLGIPVIVSIGGDKADEFPEVARRLDKVKGVSGIEINISCPNLKKRILFAQDKKAAHRVVKSVRQATGLTIITKLTPNVTNIAEIARAAERAGSDAISLVNTYAAMAVDIDTRTPRLGNTTGGLSGPAIKPIALKAVWDVYNAVDIPIIGMGGIVDARDIIEFMVCGASAVALGSINFVYPDRCVKIIGELADYMKRAGIKNIKDLTGSLKVPG